MTAATGRTGVAWPAGTGDNPVRMDAETSDEMLMLAYARGDVDAFPVLYRRHRNRLYGFLLRSLGQRDQADDCFQEVWSRVIDARHRYRPDARFGTWLLQIAHHLLIDRHRRQRPHVPLDAEALPDTGGDEGNRPERLLDRFQRSRRLRQAIAALPLQQRQAILLRLDQELALEEIAAVTGVGRETVKSRLRYAMAKLREALA